MPIQKDLGFVLRLTEYSESSQIVWLLTRDAGVVRLLGKGLRRASKTRAAVGLDLLEFGELAFAAARQAGRLGTLTEWVQRESFVGLRRELSHLYAGLYAAEAIVALTEPDDPHPLLFGAFAVLLERLSQQMPTEPERRPRAAAAALVSFQLGLLEAIGLQPELTQCVECGRAPAESAGAFFSSTAGGLLCRDCEMHHADKRSLPATLRRIDPRGEAGYAWFNVLDDYVTHVAARPIQTARVLRTAFRGAATR